MILIGEKLNSSVPRTFSAMQEQNAQGIVDLIRAQESAGAEYLDINTSLFGADEAEKMLWVVGLALEHSSCGIMLDSPNPAVIKEVIPHIKDRPVIINSVTLTERLEELLPVIKEYNASVVALPMGKAMPQSLKERMENAARLLEIFRQNDIEDGKVYIDLIAEALSYNAESAGIAVEMARKMRKEYPKVHTVCGLSNISFGLPGRTYINNAFLSALIINGMDSAILDVTNKQTLTTVYAALALAGQDEFCMDYITYARNELLNKSNN